MLTSFAMRTIISIALLMAMARTQILDSCSEYCNYLKSGQLRLFRRPDCVCSIDYQRTNNRHNKLTKVKQRPLHDNSAIYYEPSDEYPYHMTSFVDYPFFIVNPMYPTQGLKNSDTRKARTIAVNNFDPGEDLNSSKKKETRSAFDIDVDNSPLYLDIDVYKNTKNERYNNIKQEINKVGITEDDLVECVDLHILVYSRKKDHDAVADLKNIWDETKINKYKGLSDSDLMIEIKSKCHQPNNIFYESLQQIKRSLPRKTQLRPTQHINVDNVNESNVTLMNLTDLDTHYHPTAKIILDREIDNVIPLKTKELKEMVSVLSTTTDNSVIDYKDYADNNYDSSTISKEDLFTESKTADKLKETPREMYHNSNVWRIDKDFKTINFEKNNDIKIGSRSQYSNDFLLVPLESTTEFDFFDTTLKPQVINEVKTQSSDLKNTVTGPIENTTLKKFGSDKYTESVEKDIPFPNIITKKFEDITGTNRVPNNEFIKITNEFVDETSKVILTTVKAVDLNNFFPTTTHGSLDEPLHESNQNEAIKLNEDLKGHNNISHNEEEVAEDSSIHLFTIPLESSTIVDLLDTTYESQMKYDTEKKSVQAQNTIKKPYNTDYHMEIIEKYMQIPRIITKEFENSTVVSSIYGTERIPNNDFEEIPMMINNFTKVYSDKTSKITLTTGVTVSQNNVYETTTYAPQNKTHHVTNQNNTLNFNEDLKEHNNKYYEGDKLDKDSLNYLFTMPLESTTVIDISDTKFEFHTKADFTTQSDQLNNADMRLTQKTTSIPFDRDRDVEMIKNNITFPRIIPKVFENTTVSSSVNGKERIPYSDFLETPMTFNNLSKKNLDGALKTKQDEKSYFGREHSTSNLELYENSKKNETYYLFDKINVEVHNFSTTVPNESQNTEHSSIQNTTEQNLYFSVYLDKDTTQTMEKEANLDTTTESAGFVNNHKHKNQYIDNGAGFLTIGDKLTESELFNKGSQKNEHTINHNRPDENEILTLISTLDRHKGETKKQIDYQPARNFHYENSTQSKEDLLPLSTNISPDISSSLDDLTISENVIQEQSLYPATQNTRNHETSSSTKVTENVTNSTSHELVGKLYFLFGKTQVPVSFIQNSEGQIKLGFDGETLCDKIIHTDIVNSVIMKAICNCSRSKNCSNIS